MLLFVGALVYVYSDKWGFSRLLREYSCDSKSQIRKFGNRSSGTRKSPVLCLLFVHFYGNISQDLAVSAVRSSFYQYSHRNYDSACTKVNLKSDFHITGQLMETHPEYSSRIIKINACMWFDWCISELCKKVTLNVFFAYSSRNSGMSLSYSCIFYRSISGG